MDAGEKKVLVYAISAVLVIAVLLNFYHGSTVTKIDIPGLFGIEFDSGGDTSGRTERTPAEESNAGMDGFHPGQAENSTGPESRRTEEPSQASHEDVSPGPSDYLTDELQTIPEVQRAFDVAGYWYGDDGSGYEISQSGNRIEFIEFGHLGITASGSGTLTGKQVHIDYQTTFGTLGKAVLNLSDNGQVMRGRADDLTTGTSTVLTLHRE